MNNCEAVKLWSDDDDNDMKKWSPKQSEKYACVDIELW